MIKFNDNNLLVGYIKQLLHTFNLPDIKCYKEDDFKYEGKLVIKDDYIQQYNSLKRTFIKLRPYIFNEFISNYTNNLKLNSLIYDSHTHEYLGNYLRFLRDYKNLNLMPMYNCFSNRIVEDLEINWTTDDNISYNFKTDTKNYKVYAVPVKFNQKYTIAISSITPVEIICGLYEKALITDTKLLDEEENIISTDILSNETYKKITYSDFSQPFIYDALYKNENLNYSFLYEHESCLKLFIKVPNTNTSSIVVLEGEYLDTNSKTLNNITNKWEHTSTVINYEEKVPDIFLSTSLQLLKINSKVSYPFADRLIEYLTDNAVTNIEIIPDNITRIQESLIRRSNQSYDDETKTYSKVGLNSYIAKGIWEDRYKNILYDVSVQEGLLDTCSDILGYLDKDVENELGSDPDIYSED